MTRGSELTEGVVAGSEARRLLALTHNGQSRAVTEGFPVELWVDARQRTYGLEAEFSSGTSGNDRDSKAEEFALDRDVKIAGAGDARER